MSKLELVERAIELEWNQCKNEFETLENGVKRIILAGFKAMIEAEEK